MSDYTSLSPPVPLLDRRALADLLKCSPRHVDRLRKEHQMPQPVKLGTLPTAGRARRSTPGLPAAVAHPRRVAPHLSNATERGGRETLTRPPCNFEQQIMSTFKKTGSIGKAISTSRVLNLTAAEKARMAPSLGRAV